MANELAINQNILNKIILTGDIGQLNDNEKVHYVEAYCKHLGLDPAQQPFELIKFKGNVTKLYATKKATDMLRDSRKVSVRIVRSGFENGIYVAVAEVSLPDGRVDSSIGAVAIGANPSANDVANAIMKAETKAKRRATLSITGLGMLDESEVETVPGATTSSVPRETTAQVENAPDDKDFNHALLIELGNRMPDIAKRLDEDKLHINSNMEAFDRVVAKEVRIRLKSMVADGIFSAHDIEKIQSGLYPNCSSALDLTAAQVIRLYDNLKACHEAKAPDEFNPETDMNLEPITEEQVGEALSFDPDHLTDKQLEKIVDSHVVSGAIEYSVEEIVNTVEISMPTWYATAKGCFTLPRDTVKFYSAIMSEITKHVAQVKKNNPEQVEKLNSILKQYNVYRKNPADINLAQYLEAYSEICNNLPTF